MFVVPLLIALAPAPRALAVPVPPPGARQEGPSVQAINEAIDRGVAFLLRMQHADGSFAGSNFLEYPEGGTALAVAALLHSGLDPRHQAIQRGVAFVRTRPQQRYYGTTTRILMEDILGPQQDPKALKECAEFIASGAGRGYFDYPGLDKPDLSNTQYCILSLWMAQKNGVKVPEKIFEDTTKAILLEQLTDGGWGYFPRPASSNPNAIQVDNRKSTASMTTAGMSTLLFCLDAIGTDSRKAKKLKEDVDEALAKGYAWLEKHMAYDHNETLEDDDTNAKQWDLYYVYTIERLGTIAGVEELAGKPWYKTGAAHLIEIQTENGGFGSRAANRQANVTDTAFALLFLNRATESRTGEGSRKTAKVLASAEPELEEADLRVLPGERTVAWIAGFGKEVREAYGKRGEFGLRVEKVRYFVDGLEVATVEGDAGRISGNERFEADLELEPGEHTIEAVVTIAPEPGSGESLSDKRVDLDSARLRLRVDWALSLAQEDTIAELGANLVPGSSPQIEVSSEDSHPLSAGDMVADGSLVNGWKTSDGDGAPWIRMTWKRGLKAQVLVLSPLQGNPPGDYYPAPTRIELVVNGKSSEVALEGKAREHVELGRSGSVKSLEIKILDTRAPTQGAEAATGFAEIELIGKVRKQR